MLVGYARISKSDGSQDLSMQTEALVAAGVDPGAIYTDTVSGAKTSRPGLDAMLKALRGGDTLVVWRLDRLGRNRRHVEDMMLGFKAGGIDVRILNGMLAGVDTSTPMGAFVFTLFGAMAEMERGWISERTKAGLRKKGAKKGGRPPKLTPAKLKMARAAMEAPDANVSEICRELGIHTSTLYRAIEKQDRERLDASQPGAKRAAR